MSATGGKPYVRGAVINIVGIGVLSLIGRMLGITLYVGVACGIQYAVFLLHGLPMRSEKFYDLSGSLTHLALVAVAMVRQQRARSVRQVFAALAATLWMTRLGTFLYNRILRDGKDERFDQIKKTFLTWLGVWTMQAMWVTLTELPVILLNDRDDPAPLTVLDRAAMLLWGLGFVVEAAADSEKMAFRNDSANKGRYITSGLWRYSRHPNYFGEILMWSALALMATVDSYLVGDVKLLFAWWSPAFTTLLLLKVSGVPLVEKAGMKKWGEDPAYLHYIANTSCLVPWFPAQPIDNAGSSKDKKTS